jgi:hypothetical protein
LKQRSFKKSERGAAVAEFAVACLFFFTMLIGIIEFGRLLYTHNALTDAARRGARYASLHAENVACVQNIVIYGEKHVDSSCAPNAGASPLVNGITSATINVTYVGADLDNYRHRLRHESGFGNCFDKQLHIQSGNSIAQYQHHAAELHDYCNGGKCW